MMNLNSDKPMSEIKTMSDMPIEAAETMAEMAYDSNKTVEHLVIAWQTLAELINEIEANCIPTPEDFRGVIIKRNTMIMAKTRTNRILKEIQRSNIRNKKILDGEEVTKESENGKGTNTIKKS